MNAHKASLINAVVLITMPVWYYFTTAEPSMTAMIPAAFGIVLLLLSPGIKAENKVIAHVAVLLTLFVLIALVIKPLPVAISSGDVLKIIRSVAMVVTTIVAMIFFIKSFRDARIARQKQEKNA